jgi:hypothetical protein
MMPIENAANRRAKVDIAYLHSMTLIFLPEISLGSSSEPDFYSKSICKSLAHQKTRATKPERNVNK